MNPEGYFRSSVINTVMLLLIIFDSSFSFSQSETSLVSVRVNKCTYNKLGYLPKVLRLPNTIMGNNESTTFRLQQKCGTKLPHCMKPCSTEILRRTIEFPESLSREIHFTPSGYLRYGSDFFHPDEYCIFGRTQNGISVEICRPDCGKTHVCVPKCCSADKILDFDTNGCAYSLNHPWEPLVYKTEDYQVCGAKKANIRFHYFQFNPNCKLQKFFLKSIPEFPELSRVRFRLLLNGSVVLKDLPTSKWKMPEKGSYCLDGVQNVGSEIGPYTGDPLNQVLLVCPPEDSSEPTHLNNHLTLTGILYSFLLFSGTPFLLATVIVYILLWNKQNVHGWTLFSHTLAMLLNYLGQGITNTVSRVYDSSDNASLSCKLIGIVNHYFVLSSFFWLTMINYDLWSMFRHLKSTVGRSRRMRRFIVYMTIGWGVPLAVVIISVILDEKYGLYGEDGGDCASEIVIPLYGHKSCYIVEEARPYYLFYPIGSLMGINLIFAALTGINMRRHNKTTKAVEKKSTKHRRKFSVWSKLFVVMGVALMSEVVVWNRKEKDVTLPWYLVFPDVLSLLQAIAIFILFACQQKVINQLREAYPVMNPFLDHVITLPCYRK